MIYKVQLKRGYTLCSFRFDTVNEAGAFADQLVETVEQDPEDEKKITVSINIVEEGNEDE